jgi:hypothetical protein
MEVPAPTAPYRGPPEEEVLALLSWISPEGRGCIVSVLISTS